MKTKKDIAEIIDINKLQDIMDNYSKAVQMAFIVVDYEGIPVTNASNFTPFCKKSRNHSVMNELCQECDAHGGLQAAISKHPYIYRCHAGLIDFSVPLIIDGDYYGAVLGGQVKLLSDEEIELEKVIHHTFDWKNEKEFVEAYDKILPISYEKIESTLKILSDIVNSVITVRDNKAINESLEKKTKELTKEKMLRLELEKSLHENEKKQCPQLKLDFLFSSLNIATRLSYLEGDIKTENVLYNISEMFRYILEKNDSQISTLSDEMEYTKKYLSLEKVRLGDRLSYEMNIPEEFLPIFCPYFIIQPIVENAIKYAIEPKALGGKIKINSHREAKDIIITISDSGQGIPKEVIENIVFSDDGLNDKQYGYDLYNINKKLCRLLGESYMLRIENQPLGKGTTVIIKLPIHSSVLG